MATAQTGATGTSSVPIAAYPLATQHLPAHPPVAQPPVGQRQPDQQLPFHPALFSVHRLRWILGRNPASLAIAVLALAGAAIFLLAHPGEKTVPVSMALHDSDSFSGLAPQDECEGQGGYDDMHEGTQAVLTDSRGTTVATAALDQGRYDGLDCVFHFTFQKVPKADFYALKVGFTSRGDFQSSYQEMVSQNWALDVSLGGDE